MPVGWDDRAIFELVGGFFGVSSLLVFWMVHRIRVYVPLDLEGVFLVSPVIGVSEYESTNG